MKQLSAIVLTKNEEKMIQDCLESMDFCDEIVVVDSDSTDKTVEIAKKFDARVVSDASNDFSQKRNKGLEKATGEWVLYVDADERVSAELRKSIGEAIKRPEDFSAFRVKRENYYLGNHPWPKIESMERLFRKKALSGWRGALHESPIVEGAVGELAGYLTHYTHRNLSQMVAKTNQWSETEAENRYQAAHPKMVWWRFPRVMWSAFYDSYIRQTGYKAGTAGLIESIYQAFSMFITYAKLWELQEKKH